MPYWAPIALTTLTFAGCQFVPADLPFGEGGPGDSRAGDTTAAAGDFDPKGDVRLAGDLDMQAPGDGDLACLSNSECVAACIEGLCAALAAEGSPCDEDADCSAPGRCVQGACDAWYGIGGSDFGPRRTDVSWGSKAGGGISNTAGQSFGISLALDSSDAPVVAWRESTSRGHNIYIVRFDPLERHWVPVGPGGASAGGVNANSGTASEPDLVVGTGDLPVVAWTDAASGLPQVHVARFDGSSWQGVGNGAISDAATSAQNPSLALDATNQPIVVWENRVGLVTQVYAMRFDGSLWQPAGVGAVNGGGVSDTLGASGTPSIATDTAGNVVAAWRCDVGGNYEIYVSRLVAGAWEELGPGSASLGGVSNTPGTSVSPKVALDVDGNPVVAWNDGDSADAAIFVKRFTGSAWEPVGTTGASGRGASEHDLHTLNPALAIDGSNLPVVAWSARGSAGYEFRVSRFDGVDWLHSDTGGRVNARMGAGERYNTGGSLAIRSDDSPVLAWPETLLRYSQTHVAQFNAPNWHGFGPVNGSGGGVSENALGSQAADIVVHANGEISVVWEQETADDGEIHGSSFGGIAWSSLGGSDANISQTTTNSRTPSLASDEQGHLLLAWQEAVTSAHEIFVSYFDGVEWSAFGTGGTTAASISGVGSYASSPATAIDRNGLPLVAWSERSTVNTWSLAVSRFDGAVWTQIGAAGALLGSAGQAYQASSLAVDEQNAPWVAWADDATGNLEIHVSRFDNSVWTHVGDNILGGGVSGNSGYSMQPSLQIHPTGEAVVAWTDNSSATFQIYVAKFDGSAWQELGPHSASQGGVSNSLGLSSSPALALDDAGYPVIAWQDDSSGSGEIYVARFDGTAWMGVGLSSQKGGGISNSGATSYDPALAISGNQMCVTWNEEGATAADVLVRCTSL